MSEPFVHRGRVRYAETDAMGVAHHAAYAPWLEEARIRALDEVGRSYRELEADGRFMPVVELAIRYRRPLRFDDAYAITTTVHLEGRCGLRFRSRITGPDDAEIAEADVLIACVDGGGKPQRIPEDIVATFG